MSTPVPRSALVIPEHCSSRYVLRVRFCETDLMGIVHHASYLAYCEAARVEYLRRRGADYLRLTERGLHMPVIEALLRYRRPARFDDWLVIEARLGAVAGATLRFDYQILRARGGSGGEEEVLVDGHTLLACVDDRHVPRRIPVETRALLLAAESVPAEQVEQVEQGGLASAEKSASGGAR